MINKSFIDKFNIKFHEVIAKNDSYFSVNVGHYMNNFITSKDVIYCATWHDNGNVTKRKDFEFVEHSTKSRIKLLKFMENKLSKEIQKIMDYAKENFSWDAICEKLYLKMQECEENL